jgi:hypothetical protein
MVSPFSFQESMKPAWPARTPSVMIAQSQSWLGSTASATSARSAAVSP